VSGRSRGPWTQTLSPGPTLRSCRISEGGPGARRLALTIISILIPVRVLRVWFCRWQGRRALKVDCGTHSLKTVHLQLVRAAQAWRSSAAHGDGVLYTPCLAQRFRKHPLTTDTLYSCLSFLSSAIITSITSPCDQLALTSPRCFTSTSSPVLYIFAAGRGARAPL
jgi:hypothetical protein